MSKKITRSQYEEIEDANEEGFRELHKVLAEYTGIVAHPYTAYAYFDASGNYVGNSEDFDLDYVLENAYVEVVEDGN